MSDSISAKPLSVEEIKRKMQEAVEKIVLNGQRRAEVLFSLEVVLADTDLASEVEEQDKIQSFGRYEVMIEDQEYEAVLFLEYEFSFKTHGSPLFPPQTVSLAR